MKPITIKQQIMLFTGSTFSNREFSKPGKHNNTRETGAARDELERACWAGMIFEILPELAINPFPSYKMHIWSIQSAEHCLLISQGTDPYPVEAVHSIDPPYFLTVTNFN